MTTADEKEVRCPCCGSKNFYHVPEPAGSPWRCCNDCDCRWDNRKVRAPSAQAFDPGLIPETADLVQRFAAALHEKLLRAQEKYGYDKAEWRRGDWEAICRRHLYEHLAKGDPRDVANYCAFMWHHGWSTAAPSPPPPDITQVRERFKAWAASEGHNPETTSFSTLDLMLTSWCAALGVKP